MQYPVPLVPCRGALVLSEYVFGTIGEAGCAGPEKNA